MSVMLLFCCLGSERSNWRNSEILLKTEKKKKKKKKKKRKKK